ncbi:MAG: SPFH domain-containing protein [Candidatus Hodarchaeota archaeon]
MGFRSIGMVFSFLILTVFGVAMTLYAFYIPYEETTQSFLLLFGLGLGLTGLVLLIASFRILRDYESAIIFRLGNYNRTVGAGITIINPIFERFVKLDTRIQVLDVEPQDTITRDNVPVKINAVAYYRVRDPKKVIIEIQSADQGVFQIAQTTARAVVGQHELDEILTARDKINAEIQHIIDQITDDWGIEVPIVEIKDVEVPQGLKRAMAKQAEAERERRARIILAEGEFQAAEKLKDAGDLIGNSEGAVLLRLFQTIVEVSAEHNSTVLFPYPLELAKMLKHLVEHS